MLKHVNFQGSVDAHLYLEQSKNDQSNSAAIALLSHDSRFVADISARNVRFCPVFCPEKEKEKRMVGEDLIQYFLTMNH